MNQKVTEELENHIKENYRGESIPKTRAQKQITQDERLDAIKEMLSKTSLHVGIGPISMDHICNVEKALIAKGVLKNDEHPTYRKQRTVKSLVKSWSLKHLKMSEEEFESINIETILMTDNSDILFIRCQTQDDASKFTSRAKNLPQENNEKSPRIIMYVDRRASKRHRAIMTIAKSIREYSKNTVQTSVRTGKTDFLLRKRIKGDQTPWSEIPPILITQNIPEFEFGIFNDMVNPHKNIEEMEKISEVDEVIEDIEVIAEDLNRQNLNKRDRTSESEKNEKNKKANKMGRK